MLKKSPGTAVETADDFPSAEQIARADVLVFYQRGLWDEKRAAAIDPFLARGGGCVYIHWSVDGRGGQEDLEAHRLGIAGRFDQISPRGARVNFAPGKDHPILRNFDKQHWVDESYWKLTGDPKQLELLGTGQEGDETVPLFWVKQHDRGRVFVSIPGHYMWTFDDPAFRLVLLRDCLDGAAECGSV